MNKHLNIHNWVVQLRVKNGNPGTPWHPNTVINLLETTAVPVLGQNTRVKIPMGQNTNGSKCHCQNTADKIP